MRIQDHQKKDYFELKFQVVDAPYIQGPVGSFIERDTLLTTGDTVKTLSLHVFHLQFPIFLLQRLLTAGDPVKTLSLSLTL